MTQKMFLAQAAAGVLLAAMLSGCMAEDKVMTGGIDQAAPVHASDRYPITVSSGAQTIDIAPCPHLSADQREAIKSFMASARAAHATTMTISYPAAKGPAYETAREVAAVMASQGISHRYVQVATYPGPGNAPVRLSFFGAAHASVAPCGDWSKDLTDTSDNDNYPNLGCAVQSNIAAEVVNPNTFNNPRATDPKHADTAVAAVQRENAAVSNVTLPTNYDYAQ